MKCFGLKLVTLTMIVLGLFSATSLAAESSIHDKSYLARYMGLYGYKIPGNIVGRIQMDFTPQEADCGQIHVKFQEILYDGQWLYATASISPQEPETVLIIPGDAECGDPVAGYYDEKVRVDDRSFKAVAKDEGKQLLAVYAYIKEFDNKGAYFMDHFQEANDTSILMSGAQLAGGNSSVDVTWTIQIYDVDLKTGKHSFLNEYLFPITVQPLQPYIEQTYCVADSNDDAFCSSLDGCAILLSLTPKTAQTIAMQQFTPFCPPQKVRNVTSSS